MKRRLIILGTGFAMATNCYNTCFAIQMEDGEIFLTDAGGGNGIFQQLKTANLPFEKIHHCFVTHGHTDHIVGMVWVVRKIASMMAKGAYEGNFTIYGHDESLFIIREMVNLMLKNSEKNLLDKRIFLDEVKNHDTRKFLNLEMTAFDIYSTKKKQFGYQLKFDDGLRVTCLGDEPFNEACEIFVKNTDYLLSEAFCLYGDRDIFKPYEKHHSTVKEASELAEKFAVKNLILYHTEDKNLKTRKQTYSNEAKQNFHGKIFVPDDLDEIILEKN